MTKLLPSGPDLIDKSPLETWVVFSVIDGSVLTLREVARVPAGSEAAAIASAVEAGKDVEPTGKRLAFPVSRLKPKRRHVGYVASVYE